MSNHRENHRPEPIPTCRSHVIDWALAITIGIALAVALVAWWTL